MKLKKDVLYISFHKPKGLVGHLIAGWTLGKYSHVEFIYNDEVILANPGGVRRQYSNSQKSTKTIICIKNK